MWIFIKNIYKGKVIEFDLTNDLTKTVCTNNKAPTISNVTKNTRETKYVRDERDNICIN